MPNGEYVMESKAIALALEQEFPEPSVHLDSPVLKTVEEAMVVVYRYMKSVLMPRMPRECLSGPTIAWHREVREQSFGMTLEEVEAKYGGEPAWEKAMPGFESLAAILKHDPSGPFCLGSTPSYADFLINGFLEWCRCLAGGIFERVVGIDQAFKDVYDACAPWLERNDH
jgi:glutathione S-transferase